MQNKVSSSATKDLVLILPERLQWQDRIVAESSRFNVVNIGRRAGKTTLGIDRCVTKETLPYPVGWFSPTYKMLLEVWREAARIFAPITARRSVQDHRLEFVTGGVLEFWSLDNPDAARGRKYRRVITDEAAMIPNLLDAWNYVLRPTLVDYSGDAYFMSTPKGRNGFWQMWQWGQDDIRNEWASWKMPTSVNPLIPPSEIEAMRLAMPERIYAQEILAEFLEDGGGVYRYVRECATANRHDDKQEGSIYIGGIDWALSHDFTVLSIVDANSKSLVHVDRFNGVDYSLQRQRIAATCQRLGVLSVYAESNAMGKPNNDELRRLGVPVRDFVTTNASKAEIVETLASSFERRDIRILDDPQLIAELESFESDRTPSGMTKYNAPDGMHDDMAMSLAIAWYGATNRVSSYVDFA